MVFINATEAIGVIMNAGTQNLTGDVIATLFLVLLFLVVIAMFFQIPLEFLAVIVLPFCLAVGAYYTTFMVPVVIIVIYLSAIIARNWIFR